MTDASTGPGQGHRPATAVDAVAERWVDVLCDLDPTVATWIGRAGRTGEHADHSPDGHERTAAATRAALLELDAAVPVDDVDRVTVDDLRATLELDLEHHERGLHLRDLNVIASPAQSIREVFDLMPTSTEQDWADVASRAAGVPAALEGYVRTLRLGIERGTVPAARQVAEVAVQADRTARRDGFFPRLAARARLEGGAELPGGLAAELTAATDRAAAAHGEFAAFLRDELLPAAGEGDAVGRDAYELHSRRFLGAAVDLDETYAWGLDALAGIVDEQERLAESLEPGADVARAVALLDADPTRQLHGTEALREWMQGLSDRAVDALAGTHFDVPEPLRHLECRIAPTHDGGVYYTSPSDDFSRPGRMWWSVPEGDESFTTWRETSTVFHEGVPGHHLQLGTAVHERATLNTWRRQLAGTSGHAEGWALYAERLMDELGWLRDPGDRLGMLFEQRLRAARVVVDIGVHLGLRTPAGGPWDADAALAFVGGHSSMTGAVLRFEVDRYLGWPGQAPSYAIGQRLWQELRAEASRREGAAFDLRAFHGRALRLGGVGLDTLRRAALA